MPADMIDKYGAVSEPVATRDGRRRACATAARRCRCRSRRRRAGAAAAETKPVGMRVVCCWSNRLHTSVETKIFKGDCEQIRAQAAAHALRGVLALLDERAFVVLPLSARSARNECRFLFFRRSPRRIDPPLDLKPASGRRIFQRDAIGRRSARGRGPRGGR